MRRLLASLVAVVVAAFAQPAGAEIRALIVTVSQYTAPIPSLEGPPNDAAALKAVLMEQGAKDIVSINDAQATRASIRGALQALGQRSKPGDWVVFYYAGHGSQAKSTDPDEEDGMDEFLPLSGFKVSKPDPNQFILDNDLHGWLVNFFPTTVNVLQIADACHSGTMNRSLAAPSPFKRRSALDNPMAISLPPSPADPMAVAPAGANPPNLVYVGAAQDNQFALEGPLPRGDSPSRGLLTYALEGALKDRRPNGRLAADADDDGKLSLAELASSLESRTRELSSTQQWSSAAVPARNERSVIFQPLKAPPADERPVEVKPADAQAADLLGGKGPWASIPRGTPDLTWNAKEGWVTDSRGDRVAENLTTPEALSGVIMKRQAVSQLAGSANERQLKVDIGPRPKGQLYKNGESVDLAVTHRGGEAWLTAFNLAGDGTVQMLYPLEGDGDGRMVAGQTRVVMARTKASAPFGVDNVVAIATPTDPKVLRAALKRIDGKRDAMVASGLVRDELDAAKGQAAMALGELYTGR
ncbi:MAG: caspase family protein [Alphaproteobacteria bacterium]|nr:caspase family protein [Alphaproteobacteria bacterium]MBU1516951.1 caspase family protein [Alphaproteobacteria bacterium]MBU2095839.1 caspase family protein [Alphaproteobacteria bacterium]MBU2152024.1 caspase family protein [Alphaproteobacteria bacterium]MBU2309545.1 caspase family protein [Alphaproteobacteria bacterium]